MVHVAFQNFTARKKLLDDFLLVVSFLVSQRTMAHFYKSYDLLKGYMVPVHSFLFLLNLALYRMMANMFALKVLQVHF